MSSDPAGPQAPGQQDHQDQNHPLKRLERANTNVALRTYHPAHQENPRPGQWAATWYNGPERHAEAYGSESLLMTRLFMVFGRPPQAPGGGSDGKALAAWAAPGAPVIPSPPPGPVRSCPRPPAAP